MWSAVPLKLVMILKHKINCQNEVIECSAKVNQIPPLQTGDAMTHISSSIYSQEPCRPTKSPSHDVSVTVEKTPLSEKVAKALKSFLQPGVS